MTQMMDLNKMGLAHLNQLETQEIDGGGGILDKVLWWLVQKALDHPKEVIAGFAAIAEGASAGSQEKGGIFFK
ncbi:MAG: hypothetical protein ABI685_09435 [Ferruginibacter sp.]